jgi:hypothetical protein
MVGLYLCRCPGLYQFFKVLTDCCCAVGKLQHQTAGLNNELTGWPNRIHALAKGLVIKFIDIF